MRIAVAGLIFSVGFAPCCWAESAQEWFSKGTYTTNPKAQVAYFRKALEVDPSHSQARHNLANSYARLGDHRRSIYHNEQLIRSHRSYYQTYYNLACSYARLGDKDHAIMALHRAFQKGFKDWKTLTVDRDLKSLRGEPRYASLVGRYRSGQAMANRIPRRPKSPAAPMRSNTEEAQVGAAPELFTNESSTEH